MNKIKIKSETKNHSPVMGDIYENRGEVYILSKISWHGFSLVNLSSGMVYDDPKASALDAIGSSTFLGKNAKITLDFTNEN